MIKKSIYIPILLLLFIILQINNNYCYLNQSFSNGSYEYNDYVKDKTLFQSFNNQLFKSEIRENISNINQNSIDDDSLYLVLVSNFINEIPTHQIYFITLGFGNHLYSTLKSRAPPISQFYS